MLLSEKTVAARLGISRPTLLRLRRNGEISYFRIGARVLYSEEAVSEFLSAVREARRTQADKRKAKTKK